jgi:hypothetical protein
MKTAVQGKSRQPARAEFGTDGSIRSLEMRLVDWHGWSRASIPERSAHWVDFAHRGLRQAEQENVDAFTWKECPARRDAKFSARR